MQSTTKTKKHVNLIQYTYACLVFREIKKLEKILDKKGTFLGMSYYRFLLFLRIEFTKSEEDCVFDIDGILKGHHVDMGTHPGKICFLFKRMPDKQNKPSALLFLPNEKGDRIAEIKRSVKFTTEKNFIRLSRGFKGLEGSEFNLIYKN